MTATPVTADRSSTDEAAPTPERVVVVVDDALAPGLAANAAAVLAFTLGAQLPQLRGPDLVDGDGATHPGLIPFGLPILSAPGDALAALHAGALVVPFGITAHNPAAATVVAARGGHPLAYWWYVCGGRRQAAAGGARRNAA